MKRSLQILFLCLVFSGCLWALNVEHKEESAAVVILDDGDTVIVRLRNDDGTFVRSRITVQSDGNGVLTVGFIQNGEMKLGVRAEKENTVYAHHSSDLSGRAVTILDTNGDGLPDLKNISTGKGFESFKASGFGNWELNK